MKTLFQIFQPLVGCGQNCTVIAIDTFKDGYRVYYTYEGGGSSDDFDYNFQYIGQNIFQS